MELRQKTELRRLLIPEIRQSLKILTLPLPELEAIIQEELLTNPVIEETPPAQIPVSTAGDTAPFEKPDPELRISLLTKQPSLQEVLLIQLGINTGTDEEIRIGQKIIEYIDDNGFLRETVDTIAAGLEADAESVRKVLAIIQGFEPPGVGADSITQCLLIQLERSNDHDPIVRKIVVSHLEDIAKKRYRHIAKTLKIPLEEIEPLIKKILKLNPKPGRAYSNEDIQRVIPDIFINENLEVTINEETIPSLMINKSYRDMLKNASIDQKTKEFIRAKINSALELLRAIAKRKATLRRIIETVVEIQQDAFQDGFSSLLPLTFKEIAQRLDIHESTVCRAVLHKYVDTPWGIVALKNFFPSGVHDFNGLSVSSSHIKTLIRELIVSENKKHPLSDQGIVKILTAGHNLKVSRRTIAKYREEIKIPSTTYRREK